MNLLDADEEAGSFSSLFHSNDKPSRPEKASEANEAHQLVRGLLESSQELNRSYKAASEHSQEALPLREPLWERNGTRFQQYLPTEPPLIIFNELNCERSCSRRAVSQPGQDQQEFEEEQRSSENFPSEPVQEQRRECSRDSSGEIAKCRSSGCFRLTKNETKNIPKNYGKAIITFIERNRAKVTELLHRHRISYQDLIEELRKKKKGINTIADLRSLWTESRFSREIRILSCLFLRKYSLQYIFNSRVSNFASHIKYRQKLREALTDPQGFRNIKDY